MRVIDSHQHFWDPDHGDYPSMVGRMAKIRRRFGPSDLGGNAARVYRLAER
jgi:L-fuconolactonase